MRPAALSIGIAAASCWAKPASCSCSRRPTPPRRAAPASTASSLGIGMTASRAELNGWPLDPSGTARAMQMALDDAGCRRRRVDAVFAAANGSKRLDALEAAAIRTVFGPRDVPVVSLKGAIGESGAAGAAALAAALLTMANGVVPPTVGFSAPDPECRGERQQRRPTGWRAHVRGERGRQRRHELLARGSRRPQPAEHEPSIGRADRRDIAMQPRRTWLARRPVDLSGSHRCTD